MNCPICNASVTEDFGLVECSQCNAQLLVHVDGRVEVSGQESAELPVEEPQYNEPVESEEPAGYESVPADQEFSLGPGMDSDLPEQPPELPAFDGEEPQAGEEQPPMYESASSADSPDLSDLAQFANSDDSGGREGPLRYTLTVSGIDTSDVRDAFKEAITDRKFMWDIEQILRSIRKGEVQIENVPAGKAYILVTRLRNLPVQIQWEQHAVHQP